MIEDKRMAVIVVTSLVVLYVIGLSFNHYASKEEKIELAKREEGPTFEEEREHVEKCEVVLRSDFPEYEGLFSSYDIWEIEYDLPVKKCSLNICPFMSGLDETSYYPAFFRCLDMEPRSVTFYLK